MNRFNDWAFCACIVVLIVLTIVATALGIVANLFHHNSQDEGEK